MVLGTGSSTTNAFNRALSLELAYDKSFVYQSIQSSTTTSCVKALLKQLIVHVHSRLQNYKIQTLILSGFVEKYISFIEMLDIFFQSALLKRLIGEYYNVRKARRMFV